MIKAMTYLVLGLGSVCAVSFFLGRTFAQAGYSDQWMWVVGIVFGIVCLPLISMMLKAIDEYTFNTYASPARKAKREQQSEQGKYSILTSIDWMGTQAKIDAINEKYDALEKADGYGQFVNNLLEEDDE